MSAARSPGATRDSAPRVSLGGVLDARQIESIVNELFHRIHSQEQLISKLRFKESAGEMWKQAYLELDAKMKKKFDDQGKKIQEISRDLSIFEGVIPNVKTTLLEIKACRREIQKKADEKHIEETNLKTVKALESRISQRTAEYATKERLNKLEKAHEDLYNQVCAVEGMVNCKVDRSLLPILERTATQLRGFDAGLKSVKDSLEVVESKAADNQIHLEQLDKEKEDKVTQVRRMQIIHKQMDLKVNLEEFSNAVKPVHERLRVVEDSIGDSKPQFEKLGQRVEICTRRLSSLSKSIDHVAKGSLNARKDIVAQLRRLQGKFEKVSTEVNAVIDLEMRLKSLEDESGSTGKLQSAYISEIRRQITEIQSQQSQFRHQLQVATRFVNWFADVKLS
mmetsp:Transcript_13249/g.20999  ORF Transcript_13249/g.20999 Transcript_13249/m.20999 type:complete len:394 (-) Transcript_13249:113-1294(-)